MLLQTNSYIVPKEHRLTHAQLLVRFQLTLRRLGCEMFEFYEQLGTNWDPGERSGRFVQILRFRDREQQLAVQAAERNDLEAQSLIAEFCELINFPYQQDHGFFAVGFYADNLVGESVGASIDAVDDTGAGTATNEIDGAYLDHDPDAETGDLGGALRLGPDPLPTKNFQERSARNTAPTANIPESVFFPDDAGDLLQHFKANPSASVAKARNGVAPRPAPGDIEIGQVLDAGLSNDELDVEMPAELIEEGEDSEPPPPPVRSKPAIPVNVRSRRG